MTTPLPREMTATLHALSPPRSQTWRIDVRDTGYDVTVRWREEAALSLSPAASDLYEAICRYGDGVTLADVRDHRGSGWPANRKRAALAGVLVRRGLVERVGNRYRVIL